MVRTRQSSRRGRGTRSEAQNSRLERRGGPIEEVSSRADDPATSSGELGRESTRGGSSRGFTSMLGRGRLARRGRGRGNNSASDRSPIEDQRGSGSHFNTDRDASMRRRATATRGRANSTRIDFVNEVLGEEPFDETETTTHSNDPQNRDLVLLRKRKLDLEIETNQTKLKLLKAASDRVEVELVCARASRSLVEQAPDASMGDELSTTISNAVTNAFREMRSSTPNDRQPTLINRLAINKQNLSFSGNTMEWLRFKKAFEHSTAMGGYSDQENVDRLFNCLKGSARESVESLMMTTSSGIEIMKALERRFGNEDEVVLKLVGAIRALPKLSSGKTDIVEFASTVKNNVTAMLSVGHTGYINNIELMRDLLSKLTHVTISRYNDYVASSDNNSDLRTLADFLDREADLASRAGTASLFGSTYRDAINRGDKRNASSTRRVNAIGFEQNAGSSENSICWYCTEKGHRVANCQEFLNISVDDRWKWVKTKNNDRCFKCLGPRHFARSCNAPRCNNNGCDGPHHTLLHSNDKPQKSANKTVVNSTQGAESSS